jgi:hypothetical protein
MPYGKYSDALVKPIDTAVLPPQTNPLDSGVVLQTANQNSLSGDDTAEDLTTPEATLSHVELEPDADESDLTGEDNEGSTSQSTLSGSSFHTTHLEQGDYADSDESQSWQISATSRGTGTIER